MIFFCDALEDKIVDYIIKAHVSLLVLRPVFEKTTKLKFRNGYDFEIGANTYP
jgi:hypothetical protein